MNFLEYFLLEIFLVTTPSEIEKLSLEDLKDKLIEFQNQLSNLKMNHAVSPLENPLQIKTVRKTVARLFTSITIRKNQIID